MSHETWQIDSAHSSVGFTIRHMMVAKVHGRFTRFEGALEVPADLSMLEGAQAEVVIDTGSIDTGVEARDAHLRSADFFEVEKFPRLTFRGRRVERVGGDRYRVTGDLTLRDITREVVLEAEYLGQMKDPFGAERLAFSAHTSINRKDFGLTWNKAIETGGMLVADKVDIQLEVQTVRAKAAEEAA